MKIDSAIYVLTSDIDGASDPCISELADFASGIGIRPTFFATQRSPLLDELKSKEGAEIGIHPHFSSDPLQPNDIPSVVHSLMEMVPDARSFRSHNYVDSSPITKCLRDSGILYDSNLCLFMQEDIIPLRHASGIIRLPVYWEDDVHFSWPGMQWDIDQYYKEFLTPGLKVFNIHPIHFALNTPNELFYSSVGTQANQLRNSDISELRYAGVGTRTFVTNLLDRLRNDGARFHTVAETCEMFPELSVGTPTNAGRQNDLSTEDHTRYWNLGTKEKQETLRKIYDARNALDVYATSRDYNQRELEITAIARALGELRPGQLIDLGCGNGYTLLSLAAQVPAWTFHGIDFSESLISGAEALKKQSPHQLVSDVTFECGDALAFLDAMPSESVDAVLTERFLLNLPTTEVQQTTIAKIHKVLKPGGTFLMCEASMEGFRELNRLRAAVNLDQILPSSADNVSSLRFEDAEVEAYVRELGFDVVDKQGFSFFFAASRALHPALVKPNRPRFDAKINDLARQLQNCVAFEPGIGSNVLWILAKR